MVSRKAKIAKPAKTSKLKGSQPGAKTAAKQQRLKTAGTTTRVKGHVVASNARNQAKPES